MTPFAAFAEVCASLSPRTAVVLGSGLAGATATFAERASVAFGDIPGLVPPTVRGHGGRLAVGAWAGATALPPWHPALPATALLNRRLRRNRAHASADTAAEAGRPLIDHTPT